MRTVTQRELRNASAAVMDAVERGETFRITRHGTVVAELRPVEASSFATVTKAKAAFARLPAGGFEALRADADALFGEDRVGG
jgi:prevent-host-death family protein